MPKPFLKPSRPLMLLGLAALLLSCSAPNAAGPTDISQRRAMMIYMVGSDLEDDIKPRNDVADESETGKISKLGAGSSDLREMVTALSALPPAARARLDLLVAFGGARKQGWKGIRYADAECLIKDAQDDYFGNDSCYLVKDTAANMGDGATFRDFLKQAHSFSQAEQQLVILWNHGTGYLGIGNDWNFEGDALELQELKSAFADSAAASPAKPARPFDLIGFDACLMSTLEVAQGIAPYGKLMVASQALEPGHGWNYEDIITRLALSPNQDMTAQGKFLVDSFQETERHRKQVNKTLALLDLQAVPAVTAAIDTLINSLDLGQFETLVKTLRDSQSFGQSTADDYVLTLDAADWLQKLGQALPAAQAEVRQALQALQKLVLYQRQDGSYPQANGIGLFSLSRNLHEQYTSAQAFSPAWFGFTQAFHLRGTGDAQAPSLVGLKKDRGCPDQASGQGHCFEIRDNVALSEITQVFAVNRLDGSLQMIGRDRIDPERNQPQSYFMPAWTGKWFLLCDGNCLTGQAVFPPLAFESFNSEKRTSVYAADAVLNDQAVQFYLEVDEKGQAVNQWALPYQRIKGKVVVSRLNLSLQTGDRLRFNYQIVDPVSKSSRWESGLEIRFSSQPNWQFSTLADSLSYYLEATDYQGNRAVSELYELAEFQGDQE